MGRLPRGRLFALTRTDCLTPSFGAVPSSATLYIDRRLTAGGGPEVALAQLRDLPSARAVDAEVSLLAYQRTSFTGVTLGMDERYSARAVPEDHVVASHAPGVVASHAPGGTGRRG